MIKRISILCVALLLSAAIASQCLAAPQVGTRILSMGGSGVALADDGSAPFVNPAGISLIENLLTVEIGGDPELLRHALSLYDFAAGALTAADCQTLFSHWTTPTASLYASYNNKWYGVSLLGYGEFSGNELAAMVSLTLSGAYQFENIPRIQSLSLGANAHLFRGTTISALYDPQTELLTTDTARGTGYSFDLGVILQANDWFRCGLVAHNVWYAFEGTRTYRVTDMANGDVMIENNSPYQFHWGDTLADAYGDIDEVLFPSVPGAHEYPAERTTFDLAMASRPFEELDMTLTVDVKGIGFVNLNQLRFTSVNAGYEQTWGAWTFRLGAAAVYQQSRPFADVGAGVVYRFDRCTLSLGANWGEQSGLNVLSMVSWRL